MFSADDKIYQILTAAGEVVGDLPDLSAGQLVKAYRWMIFGRAFSDRMVALQRQGRMGTFSPLNGQEAASVGLALPLQQQDWLLGSYRETLSYLVKGVPLMALLKHWGGDIADSYTREAHCLPFQIVIGTQLPHAVGIAQAIQYDGEPQVVVVGCGDGATSEGDFHEALNFAGVFKAPVIFVIQNNGWAISIPRSRQTAASYLADRGPGFGVPSAVVDGNDLLAVYQVVADSVARARAGDGSTLIEAITYRLGAHTTADDPKKYRSEAEVEEWAGRDPIPRFRNFLLARDMLTEIEDRRLHEEVAAELKAAIDAYEALPPQKPQQLFNLVYQELSPQLRRQQNALLQELEAEVVEPASHLHPPQDELLPELAR
ncbi:MAG: pyruvate dehydrogenase (acetyl-transferring) E1 component subunit alpha [Chloroflexota bacterium]